MRRAVLDTNVVVSALLKSEGPCARLLDLVLVTHAVEACVDRRILAEYQDVVLRFAHPATGKRLIASERAEAVLEFFHHTAMPVIAQPLAVALPDPDDLCFLEVAASGPADLVTGNRRHFPKNLTGSVPVFSPAEYLENLRTSP
jgi:uncharacterized protein